MKALCGLLHTLCNVVQMCTATQMGALFKRNDSESMYVAMKGFQVVSQIKETKQGIKPEIALKKNKESDLGSQNTEFKGFKLQNTSVIPLMEPIDC